MKVEVRRAYQQVRNGYSADRVIADPQLNALFIEKCRELELTNSAFELNFALLNLRKQGKLRLGQSKRTSFGDQDEYRFSSEIAIRYLERRDQTTIDRILCDPGQAAEFDSLCQTIAPGFLPVQYRWAALGLRKASCLKPEILARVVQATTVFLVKLSDLMLDVVTSGPGLYIFYSEQAVLYVGESHDLRTRLKKHLDHSDSKGLARWLWEHGSNPVSVEWHELPAGVSTRVRRALETELIRSRKPVFNVQR